jgi:hypothetical protein
MRVPVDRVQPHLVDRVQQGEELLVSHGIQRGDDELRVLGLLLMLGVDPVGHLLLPMLPPCAIRAHQELIQGVILVTLQTSQRLKTRSPTRFHEQSVSYSSYDQMVEVQLFPSYAARSQFHEAWVSWGFRVCGGVWAEQCRLWLLVSHSPLYLTALYPSSFVATVCQLDTAGMM